MFDIQRVKPIYSSRKIITSDRSDGRREGGLVHLEGGTANEARCRPTGSHRPAVTSIYDHNDDDDDDALTDGSTSIHHVTIRRPPTLQCGASERPTTIAEQKPARPHLLHIHYSMPSPYGS